MYNITIIFSRHSELGKCNSKELYKIFEQICPDVIFEELPPSSFENYYVFKTRRTLETTTINHYIENNKISNIGVDSDNVPNEKFFSDYKTLYNKIETGIDRNGFDLRNSMDANKISSQMYGFEYLNSLQCQQCYCNVNEAIENGVEKLNDEKFFKILASWKEVIDLRENTMLKNIYSYCQNNKFNNAIFTIGAAHRKSLLDKISIYDKTEQIKINWKLYGTIAST